jgi:hypothetical protein
VTSEGEQPIAAASWSELTTETVVSRCQPPFSFFFDLIDVTLKAPDAARAPLHRLCTLSRKQGVTHIIVESAMNSTGVRSEIDALDAAAGGGGTAEAIRISFLASADPLDEAVDLAKARLLAQATVINYRSAASPDFERSYVFEAIAPSPEIALCDGERRGLPNNFIYVEDSLPCEMMGKPLTIRGIHYCQQNGFTHVCAHAVLRMALAGRSGHLSSGQINELVGITDPTKGMQVDDIIRVIEHFGYMVRVIAADRFNTQQYISALSAIVESGDRALLVFTTGNARDTSSQDEHVVLVIGHTRHSDEWHPQAIPAYAGPSATPYYPSSEWIDHFLIHDDNFGPYLTLSSHALEHNPNVSAKHIIAIRERDTNLEAPFVEPLAASQLGNLLPSFKDRNCDRWLQRIAGTGGPFVLRSLLITRAAYTEHLAVSRGHDGSAISESELNLLRVLPEHFWIVEFSLPALFTGNHSKLGEVIIAAHEDPSVDIEDQALTLAVRLPGFFLTRKVVDDENFDVTTVSLTSHSPVFRLSSNTQIW